MKIPKLCRDKRANGDLAYVCINRVKIHLGKWGTPEAVEKYNWVISQWNATKQVPVLKRTVASEDIEKIIELLTRIVAILEAKV